MCCPWCCLSTVEWLAAAALLPAHAIPMLHAPFHRVSVAPGKTEHSVTHISLLFSFSLPISLWTFFMLLCTVQQSFSQDYFIPIS